MLHAFGAWITANPLLALLTWYVIIDIGWNHGVSKRLAKLERKS